MPPADLIPNELDTLRKECAQYSQQDEDVLTYALFPQVATDSSNTEMLSRQK